MVDFNKLLRERRQLTVEGVSMAPVARKPVAPTPQYEVADFGSLDFYQGGFTLPEGEWAMEFSVILQQPHEKSRRQIPRVGMMLTAYPMKDGAFTGGASQNQFLSFGSKAHESWMPNPDTGKGVVKIPDGAGQPMNNKTNWVLFLDSLYQCGLPVGVFTNDSSTLDGTWVRTALVPEPEERKGFGSTSTGEVEEQRTNAKIPVVVEILEGGKPWEGGGGLPTEGEEAPASKAAPAKTALKATPKPAPKAAAPEPEEAGEDDEAVKVAAVTAISSILEKPQYAASCPKIILKTGAFKAANDADKDMAQLVQTQFLNNDTALGLLLGELGYSIVGNAVKPQA